MLKLLLVSIFKNFFFLQDEFLVSRSNDCKNTWKQSITCDFIPIGMKLDDHSWYFERHFATDLVLFVLLAFQNWKGP